MKSFILDHVCGVCL